VPPATRCCFQIAHPTVAAGVSQFSDYQSDPLGRLLRSIDYLMLMVFGGPDAAVRTARTLRRMHTRITGTAADGRRYHALEPEAWAWVHATLGDAALAGTQHFARPLAPAERAQFYSEWRAMGASCAWTRTTCPRLARLPRVLRPHGRRSARGQRHRPGVPHVPAPRRALPVPLLDGPVWRLAWAPAGELAWTATVGLLPPQLRERFGVRWTLARQRQFQALGALARAAGPLMPAVNRVYSPENVLRWRRASIEREYLVRAAPP
jgi:uncharacterized protein (DUF2236 family)